ncbi:MAG TPA: hypothetical protein VJ645_05340 [Gaiellaceae bacterium]|jgi:uncharacterized membrane protein|nr:hypothetical protein [Gaiellaceae bacterium]
MPFRVPSLLYVVIGLIVAFVQDYLDSLGTISRILTALLAVLLWPLVLLGFDVRISR